MLPYFDNCIRSFNIYKYMLVLKLLAFRFFFSAFIDVASNWRHTNSTTNWLEIYELDIRFMIKFYFPLRDLFILFNESFR